jgi:multiphosphoryl transfer protein
MVSIVIVSHSARLAEGVSELAEQMVQGRVALAAAGGIDDPDHPIGTDPMKVLAAIESVYSEDGVLVLMDLGSALLSAETALEFLSPEKQANVRLCAAPLVEGTISAAVQAMVGSNLDQVMAEALGALKAKNEQLKLEYGAATAVTPTPDTASAEQIQLTIPNKLGLHARPAARFVQTANKFRAEIQVGNKGKTANAKSINQVVTLNARQDDTITITAVGSDAAAALAAFQALATDNFGDRDEGDVTETAVPTTAKKGELTGIPASAGIAIGPVFQYRPRLPQIETHTIDNPDKEWKRLATAVATAKSEIKQLHTQAVAQVGEAEAAIFEAHLLFLEDPDFMNQVQNAIFEQKINAEAAWQQIAAATADTFRNLDSAYMQARAADVLDVAQRVLRHLLGVEAPILDMPDPAILLAADLTPSDTARLDPNKVLGLAIEVGGATSHSAILARALGIPAIVGMGPALADIAEGQLIAMDGGNGRLWLKPNKKQQTSLRAKRETWLEQQQAAKAAGKEPAITKDGRSIEIAANIGGPLDTAVALDYGAEGVGLFRTEFLFLGRDSAPSEDEQFNAYKKAAKAMGRKPLIIRTLDIGGDKPIAYINQEREDNPFLGYRGIRFCLDHPKIFKPQLRAILRASAGANIKLMFPMVGTVDELRRAKAVLADCMTELKVNKLPFDENLEIGIMVEVPSAVAVADQLAVEAHFFSIGTNDLTQYVMAADRGNAHVANLADALQPAVLRMIKQTISAAHTGGIWVGMCGELAGNALATPLLIGLGLDELSMNAPSIPGVKTAVRRYTIAETQKIAREVLKLDSAEAVLAHLQRL